MENRYDENDELIIIDSIPGDLTFPGMEDVRHPHLTPVYLVSEIEDEDVKQRIIEKHVEYNIFDDWWDCVYEGFKEDMLERGFKVDNINFSGFHSQGDGACFEGSVDNAETFIKWMDLKYLKLKMLYAGVDREEIIGNFNVSTRACGNYNDCRCMSVDVGDDIDHELLTDSQFQDIEESITTALRDEADKLYSQLNVEYDFLTGEEAIIESLDASEKYFYANGVEA